MKMMRKSLTSTVLPYGFRRVSLARYASYALESISPGILRAADRSAPYRDAGTNQRIIDFAYCTSIRDVTAVGDPMHSRAETVDVAFRGSKSAHSRVSFSQKDWDAINGCGKDTSLIGATALWHGTAHRDALLGSSFDRAESTAEGAACFEWAHVMTANAALGKALESFRSFGFVVLRGADSAHIPEALAPGSLPEHIRASTSDPGDAVAMATAQRLTGGGPRSTHYEPTFKVQSKPNPESMAYTGAALPLHTDLPYREQPPTVQLLHCAKAAPSGGGASTLADGFRAAARLRKVAPRAAAELTTTPVGFRWQGNQRDRLRAVHPVLEARRAWLVGASVKEEEEEGEGGTHGVARAGYRPSVAFEDWAQGTTGRGTGGLGGLSSADHAPEVDASWVGKVDMRAIHVDSRNICMQDFWPAAAAASSAAGKGGGVTSGMREAGDRFMTAYGQLARLLDSELPPIDPSDLAMDLGGPGVSEAEGDVPGAAVLRFRLRPGDVLVFDNRRMLHGREPFDPMAGERLLHGLYLDADMLESRARRLDSDAGAGEHGEGELEWEPIEP